LLRNVLFLSFLIIIFVYDWLYREVLTNIVWMGGVLGFLINGFLLGYSIFDILAGSVLMGGFFLAQYLISKGRWIGGGDVRLGFMFGVWLGWQLSILALLIAYILGALVGIYLLATKKANRKTELPFGSFLAVAVFICVLYGNTIIGWYMGLLG